MPTTHGTGVHVSPGHRSSTLPPDGELLPYIVPKHPMSREEFLASAKKAAATPWWKAMGVDPEADDLVEKHAGHPGAAGISPAHGNHASDLAEHNPLGTHHDSEDNDWMAGIQLRSTKLPQSVQARMASAVPVDSLQPNIRYASQSSLGQAQGNWTPFYRSPTESLQHTADQFGRITGSPQLMSVSHGVATGLSSPSTGRPGSVHAPQQSHSGGIGMPKTATGAGSGRGAWPGAGTMAGVLNLATRRIGVKEIGYSNRGPEVDSYMTSAGLPPAKPYDGTKRTEGESWCMAFVYDTFLKNHMTQINGHPVLTKTASCQSQANFAAAHGRLVGPQEAHSQMKPGWVMLQWGKVVNKKTGQVSWRYHHTGIVTKVHPDGTFDTIEGNSNTDGSDNGNEVVAHSHRRLNQTVTRPGHGVHPKYMFVRTTP
jgi:hypothetical protein